MVSIYDRRTRASLDNVALRRVLLRLLSLLGKVLRDLRESLARHRMEAGAVKEFDLAVLPWRMPNVRPPGLRVEEGMRVRVHAVWWLPRNLRSEDSRVVLVACF